MKQLAGGALLIALWAATGCSGVRGNGNAATESRSVGSFSTLEVSSIVQLHLTLGTPQSVTLSGDGNLLPLVTTDAHNNSLHIGTRERLRPKLDLVAAVTAENVTAIGASGAADVRVEGIHNERLALDISGASDTTLRGETKTLSLDLSGAGDVDATALVAKSVTLHVSGAGTVELGEPDELDVEISGAATVRYRGNPRIDRRVSGAGKLEKR